MPLLLGNKCESILLQSDSMKKKQSTGHRNTFSKTKLKRIHKFKVFIRDSLFAEIGFARKFSQIHLWMISGGSWLHPSGHFFGDRVNLRFLMQSGKVLCLMHSLRM